MGSDGSATTSLAPGFRFHPTDEELVSYYLRRKLSRRPFRFDAIGEIDIYKTEPWILPGLSKLKTRDLEWYFFSGLDKKYENGSRTNRATEQGYWKTTGKDRPVHHKGRVVGMKKTLVYHRGRAPRGERTNWVMHEYCSIDEELQKAGVPLEAFVLCRIFQKSGSGPKNGEKYGAPLIDEEWEDDNIVSMLPGSLGSNEALVEQNLSDQGLDVESFVNVLPPLALNQGAGSNYVEDPGYLAGNEQKPLTGVLENLHSLEFPDDQIFFDLPLQLEGGMDIVKNEYPPEQCNASNPASAWPFEPKLDTDNDSPCGDDPSSQYAINASFDDGLFLEANDLSEPFGNNPSDFYMVQEYLTVSDVNDDIEKYLSLDPKRLDTEVFFADQASFTEKNFAELALLPSYGNQVPEAADSSSSSQQQTEKPKSMSDHYPMGKQLNHIYGTIPAPPASASELPTKAMTAHLNGATPSSGHIRVTAGMVRIRDMNTLHWSLNKLGNVNAVVSFDLPDSLGLVSTSKMASVVYRGWICFVFIWFLVLAASVKIATCIYAK